MSLIETSVDHLDQQKIEKLKSLRVNVNWEIEEERRELLDQLYLSLINDWRVQLPNLRDIFLPEEIEHILSEAATHEENIRGRRIVEFVVSTGYRDEPQVDVNGVPISRRSTPLNGAAKHCSTVVVHELFRIYNRFDVNYVDEESGYTHFHVACATGLGSIVEKFLEQGQDPNRLVTETGDSPLHLALRNAHKDLSELLLRYGASPNSVNKEGSTPLHLVGKRRSNDECDLAKMLFELSRDEFRPVRVDARDKWGNAPLHVALRHANLYGVKKLTELMMRRGADPNLVNEEGSTPLHVVCERCEDENLAELFFEINDEMSQTVRVDARDKEGRTPLERAVANLMPRTVGVLLDHGADLSKFVFPAASHFAEKLSRMPSNCDVLFKLRLASGILAVVELLEERGYELDLDDALTIMKFFDERELFEKSDERSAWYDEDEFARVASRLWVNQSLSLYDLTRLGSKKVAKLFTFGDYYELASTVYYWHLPNKVHYEACSRHLSEKVSRTFFREWALDCFLKLIGQRLPILCCEKIFENLKNEDLWRICLAAKARDGH
ncbi:unnamed protein product [Trichogramma brassicae]|uniref:Uncharacterized protein n=1 Tax=Trichogramma brassicae TaxID=86971 RepID=A0A6H5I209_9HYME|nr:unnamed protein product [Trichogramma brassicae]